MKRFGQFAELLDTTTSTNQRVEHLVDYLSEASDSDKLYTIALLSGKRPKRGVKLKDLRLWASELAGIPEWLFEESYHIVGDLAETIALVLPPPQKQSDHSLTFWMKALGEVSNMEDQEKEAFIKNAWNSLDKSERFVFNKLITGGFRIGISQKLMVRALSRHTGIDENELAHRLMGNWTPDKTEYRELIFEKDESVALSRPYPFFLAYPFEEKFEDLGKKEDWQAEYKWDGIRSQLIKRKSEVFLWSRGEELINDSFPDLIEAFQDLPDGTAIDGELLITHDGVPAHFSQLQKRLNRKSVSAKMMRELPAAIIAYDLLEWEASDIRSKPLSERRKHLEELISQVSHPRLLLSEALKWSDWEELARIREKARENHSEGLMLKNLQSPYMTGRKKGAWWKWKTDPLLVDGVLLYAMRGKGRRSNLYTDYTFAAWDGDRLVPFTKAYSGLTDGEFRSITSFVRRNTLERHGPVSAVKPELVFEIAFEGIAASKRHKSGVALRFPRMKRWRKDKPASEAVTLDELQELLRVYGDG